MTAEELRAMIALLQGRVEVGVDGGTGALAVSFSVPTPEDVERVGLDGEGARRLLAADWFGEMVDEVVTTPTFCDPADPPELVLRYARDVVAEYIWKRFAP